jgi:signal transduction histidine kinase/CheY-like chemotaxis protein
MCGRHQAVYCLLLLPTATAYMSDVVYTALHSSSRLRALRELEMLDTSPEPTYDRITKLLQRILAVPVAAIVFIDDQQGFVKSVIDSTGHWAATQYVALSHIHCPYVIAYRSLFVINDARTDPELATAPAVTEVGTLAYAGVPLWLDGEPVGTLCACSDVPHEWSPTDLEALHDLGVIVSDELSLRRALIHARMVEDAKSRLLSFEQERRMFERKLQEAQKLESLGILAGGIAHDFNNLLVAIMGNAELALLDLEPDHPARPGVEQVELASRKAATLTAQMLAYSGRGRFVVEPLDLNQLVTEMGNLLRASVSRSINIFYELAPGLPLIEGDTTQINQVVMNLVINAAEAITDQHGTIMIMTERRSVGQAFLEQCYNAPDIPPGEYIALQVIDTGIGMLPSTQSRIFEPFFTTKFTGRGLGLAAVLGIVRSHNGAVHIQSTFKQGTTMTVLLPITSSLSPPAVPPLPALQSTEQLHNKLILVVDDEEEVRKVTARMLDRLGCKTLVASDGYEAIMLLQRGGSTISGVLLDMTMPHISGDEVLRQMRILRRDLPIILMSGYTEEEILRSFGAEGPTGFLQKPFSPIALQRLLNQALSHTPATDQE